MHIFFLCLYVCDTAVNKINLSFMFLMAEERIKKLPVLHSSPIKFMEVAYVHVHMCMAML